MKKYKDKVESYFKENPNASLGEVAKVVGCSKSTVNKYKPQELKAPPLTVEEMEMLLIRSARADEALSKLPWHVIREIRNANGFKLYPIDWEKISASYWENGEQVPFSSKEEFETLLKELFDNLYDWHLYERCPKCQSGIRIPVWSSPRQWTPMCGCSNYPECDYAIDRGGEILTESQGKSQCLER